MLRNLVLSEALKEFDSQVVSLTTLERIGTQLVGAGVPTSALGAQRGILKLHHWRCLRRVITEWRPHIVHSWMYHSNVAVAAVLATIPPSRRGMHVGAVRAAATHSSAQSRMTRLVRRLDARLSQRFDRLVFNAVVSREQHRRLGYAVERAVVIPNGFDTEKFRPIPESRSAIRRDLGVSSEFLIGMVARYHPVKGHRYFIEAAARAIARGVPARIVLTGPGCDRSNQELQGLLKQYGVLERTQLLGERADVDRVLNALDLLVSASTSESFPNAVGEAMACGVPCIVTDVGDCASLIGDTGWVVPACDTTAMSSAMLVARDALQSGASSRSALARERIKKHFSLERIAEQYRDLYTLLLAE